MKTPADLLRAAADLIEPEGRWCQGAYAQDGAYCAGGALMSTGIGITQEVYNTSWNTLSETVQTGVVEWNDDPDRTQQEVVDALRLAAKRWEEENE